MTYAEKLKQAQNELRTYISEKAEGFAVRCLNNGGMLHISTCGTPNWDQKLHRYMDDIVYEMKEMGVSCYHSVSWGVDDWNFKVEV